MENSHLAVGHTYTLNISGFSEHGAYLKAGSGTEVLLPGKQIPEGAKTGDAVTVFLYRDSEDRLIATTGRPKAEAGSLACLQVRSVTRIGAFLDWGLEKDLFLPFQEMEGAVSAGNTVPVYIYTDRSDRLCGSMKKVGDHLEPVPAGLLKKDDAFTGVVYKYTRTYGAFTAVFGKDAWYYGLIPPSQVFRTYRAGDAVEGRIVRVREDGKLDLSVRQKAYKQIEEDAEKVLDLIREYGGILPYADNASPELIRRELNMSKSGFKKALGHLYKQQVIELSGDEVRLIQKRH